MVLMLVMDVEVVVMELVRVMALVLVHYSYH